MTDFSGDLRRPPIPSPAVEGPDPTPEVVLGSPALSVAMPLPRAAGGFEASKDSQNPGFSASVRSAVEDVPAGPHEPPVQPVRSAPAAPRTPSKAVARRQRRQNLPALPARPLSDAEKASLATLEVEMGGRMKLVTALSQAALDKDGYRFLQLAADPMHDSCSLAEICQLANVSVVKVMAFVRAAVLARAHLISSLAIAEHLPDVTRHVMLDAIPGERECPRCQGLTTIDGKVTDDQPHPDPVTCPDCRGRGARPYSPDLALRKTALTLGEMLGKGGPGVVVNNNIKQTVGVFGGSTEAFDRLTVLTDTVLYGTGRDRVAAQDADDSAVVDTTVVEPRVIESTAVVLDDRRPDAGPVVE